MIKKSHLTLTVFAMIVLNDIGDTIAQTLMKKGLTHTGVNSFAFDAIWGFVMQNIASPLLWLGILIYTLNFFIWMLILYKVDLSVAMPVGSTSYVFIPVSAMFFLGEHVGILRWAGIGLIILGIHFVSQSKKIEEAG